MGHIWVKHGVAPYTGSVDNKTPGIFMLFAFSNLLFGVNIWFPRLLGVLSMTLTSLVIYFIGKKIYNRLAGIFAMIIFGLTMRWEFMDGPYAAQVESFMNLFTALAFLTIVISLNEKNLKKRSGLIFFSGFLIGIAIQFKEIALLSAFALFLVNALRKSKLGYKSIFADSFILIAGTWAAIWFSLIPLFVYHVTFKDYWQGAWLILLHGTSCTKSILTRMHGFSYAWKASIMIFFYPFIFIFISQRKRIMASSIFFGGLVIWFIFDFLGVNASGYYTPHHFKQLMPSLALISGISVSVLVTEIFKPIEIESKKITLSIMLIILILWFPHGFLFKGLTNINMIFEKNPGVKELQPVVDYIKTHTDSRDYVYIYNEGTAPILLASDKLSSSKYFCFNHINTIRAKQNLGEELKDRPAKLILIPTSQSVKNMVPQSLKKVINDSYKFKTDVVGYDIFEKVQ